jgi:hypothetical protein
MGSNQYEVASVRITLKQLTKHLANLLLEIFKAEMGL